MKHSDEIAPVMPSGEPSMPTGPAEPTGLEGARAVLAMLGICFVIMLVAFDQTVVGTALPRIVAELQGFALYSWVATAYLLMSTIFVPIMGRLGDLFGRKRFVLASIVLFTAASALCGMADSMMFLVLARALQGVGGGMLIGTSFACVADIFPNQLKRIRWQAMISSAYGLANAIGPTLGGYLTENHGWRSVFYVNLPIGLFALLVVARYLPRVAGHRDPGASIDWSGALLLASSIGALLVAMEEGAHGGAHGGIALAGPLFWILLALAIGVGMLFVRSQQRAAQPILPLRLFRVRAVQLISLIGVFTGWAMFTLIFYAPLLLQAGFALSPKVAGLVVSPVVVMISVGSVINGRLYGRVHAPHRLLSVGVLMFLMACVAVILIPLQASIWWIAAAFALGGLGLGFQLPNLTIQIQAAVERRDVGMASALVQTVRMLGSLIGAALSGVIVTAVYRAGADAAAAAQGAAGAALGHFFADPQVLVSAADRALAVQAAAPIAGGELALEVLTGAARAALVNGVHAGLMVSVALCAVSYALALRLPPLATQAGPRSGDA